MKSRHLRYVVILAGILVIALPALAACATAPASAPPPASAPAPSYTVKTMSKADLGDYLVDGKGMTLYYFTKDTVGKSNASAAVIANWPIFYTASFLVPSNLNASDFGTITGSNGQMQTTYKGWPLYYYIKDQAAGDTLGQGVVGVWFVINPQTVPLPPASP
jgi:predicted lipoprotein with Yx(FWY)xxD motif